MKCRPLIKIFAGKSKMAATIIKRMPEHRVYVEPFVGGGAVFFRKDLAEVSVLNDINPRFYRTYKMFQDDPEAIITRLTESLYGREEYTRAAKIFKNAEEYTDLEVAWATVYGYATSYRKKIGCGFSSYPTADAKSLRSEQIIFRTYINTNARLWADKLKGVKLIKGDAVDAIRANNGEDYFIYCDPPYIDTELTGLGTYGEQEFVALLNTLSTIESKFMISCFDNDIIRSFTDTYKWGVEAFDKQTSVSHKQTGKRKTELLVTNY